MLQQTTNDQVVQVLRNYAADLLFQLAQKDVYINQLQDEIQKLRDECSAAKEVTKDG